MDWYYAEAGQRVGPISESELQGLYAAGKLRPETLVWSTGMPGWQPLGQAQPTLVTPSAPSSGFCTECGRQFPATDLLAYGSARVCATCKDVFFQRLREQGTAATAGTFSRTLRYGGFWIRLLARILDGFILSVFSVLLLFAFGILIRGFLVNRRTFDSGDMAMFWSGFAGIYFLWLLVFVIYEAWFLSRRGATPGKLALGLQVVRSNGEKLSSERGLGRALAYLLDSLIPFAIGFIMAGLDEEKRSLHDRICDTRVVYKSP